MSSSNDEDNASEVNEGDWADWHSQDDDLEATTSLFDGAVLPSPDAALKSFGVTLSALAAEASALGITLHLRQATKNPWAGLVDTAQWCVHVQRCHGAARVRVCCTGFVCACVYILDCAV